MEQTSQGNTAQNLVNTTLAAGNIHWYSADKADESIIAYGFYCQNPKPTDSKKGDDFKIIQKSRQEICFLTRNAIVYKNKMYLSYKKVGKKFVFLHEMQSLGNAQLMISRSFGNALLACR